MPFLLMLFAARCVTNPTILTDPAQGIPTTLEHLLATVTNFQVPTILQALIGDPGTAYDGDFWRVRSPLENDGKITVPTFIVGGLHDLRSEEHTSELQSLMRISYAVFCLKKKIIHNIKEDSNITRRNSTRQSNNTTIIMTQVHNHHYSIIT